MQKPEHLRPANYVFGKGMITEDTDTGKYGLLDDEENVLIPFEYEFPTIFQMTKSGSFKRIPTVEEIISTSINGEDIDEYKSEVVKLVLEALGIQRYIARGDFQAQGGLRENDYSKVVTALYTIIGEILEKGDTKFILYEYGHRNEEYEAFRKRLSELTGIDINYFTSSLERRRKEIYYFSQSDTDYMHKASKLMIQKPVLFIGREKSYYQADFANENEYIKTITRNSKKLYNLL